MKGTVKQRAQPQQSRPAVQPRSDYFNPYPRYLQIRGILARRLAESASPGDRFPTEQQLCREFGVSRETVREALAGLEDEGFIARHRGRGSVVLRRPEQSADERLTGLVEDFTDLGLDTRVRVLRAGEEPVPARVAGMLHLARGATLFRILRLREVQGRVFALHDAYLPAELGAALAARDLGRTTLFRELRSTRGREVAELYQHVDAVAADLASARLLDTDVGAPLLVTRRVLGRRADGQPTMYFESSFRSDRYYYTVQVDRRKGSAARLAAPTARARRPRTAG